MRYVELNEVGILHRSNEVTRPRWREDSVYKLILGTNGPLSFDTPRTQVNVEVGQCLFLNPEEKHQQVRCEGDKFLFEFSPQLVNEVTREVMGQSARDVRFRHTTFASPELTRAANSIIPELHESYAGKSLLLEHAAIQILVLATRAVTTVDSTTAKMSECDTRSVVGPGKLLDQDGIRRAMEMMTECYRDKLSLDDISIHTDMSKFALIRQFREAMGITPYEWLQRYRLKRVCEDLLQTERTVLHIALDHGFTSISSLNRNFRRLYGISPKAWRQLHR